MQEYYTDLPLSIVVLERRLGRSVDVPTSTSTDEPEVITKDGEYVLKLDVESECLTYPSKEIIFKGDYCGVCIYQ